MYNLNQPNSDGFPNEVASALMKTTTKKGTIYGSKSKGFAESPKIQFSPSPKQIKPHLKLSANHLNFSHLK